MAKAQIKVEYRPLLVGFPLRELLRHALPAIICEYFSIPDVPDLALDPTTINFDAVEVDEKLDPKEKNGWDIPRKPALRIVVKLLDRPELRAIAKTASRKAIDDIARSIIDAEIGVGRTLLENMPANLKFTARWYVGAINMSPSATICRRIERNESSPENQPPIQTPAAVVVTNAVRPRLLTRRGRSTARSNHRDRGDDQE